MVTLVFCGDIKYCPYLKRYTDRLDAGNVPYEVLFWNRGQFKLNLPQNYFYFDYASPEDLGMAKKLVDFIKFRKWVVNHLKSSRTDSIICLSTLVGVLLSDKIRRYPYVFDIRDYSYEHFYIFRKIEEKVIENSRFTCISSEGFKAFLPKYEYTICHNFDRNEITAAQKMKELELPINIVWNGTVRYFEFQKHYLDAFKNDDRFLFIYHGLGTDLEQYKAYCKDNNIQNAVFTGEYHNKDKPFLLSSADVLNNCYGDFNADNVRFAVSNRFYDGLIYKIPQIVEPGGVKASIVSGKTIGIELDANDQAPEKLYQYLMNLNHDKFNRECEDLLSEIIREDDAFIRRIDEFIKG